MNRSRLSTAGPAPSPLHWELFPAGVGRLGFQFSFPQPGRAGPGWSPALPNPRSTGSPVSGICSYFRSNIPLPLSIQSSRRDITVSDSLFIVAPFGVSFGQPGSQGVGQIQKAPRLFCPARLRTAFGSHKRLMCGWLDLQPRGTGSRPRERWHTLVNVHGTRCLPRYTHTQTHRASHARLMVGGEEKGNQFNIFPFSIFSMCVH